jgi:cell division protein FtsN
MSVKGKIELATAWAFANPQTALITTGITVAVLIIVAVIGILFWAFHQTDSVPEQQADNSRVKVIGKQSDVNVQEQHVQDANREVKDTENASKDAEKAVTASTG